MIALALLLLPLRRRGGWRPPGRSRSASDRGPARPRTRPCSATRTRNRTYYTLEGRDRAHAAADRQHAEKPVQRRLRSSSQARAVEAYKGGNADLEAIMGGDDVLDAMRRSELLDRVNARRQRRGRPARRDDRGPQHPGRRTSTSSSPSKRTGRELEGREEEHARSARRRGASRTGAARSASNASVAPMELQSDCGAPAPPRRAAQRKQQQWRRRRRSRAGASSSAAARGSVPFRAGRRSATLRARPARAVGATKAST